MIKDFKSFNKNENITEGKSKLLNNKDYINVEEVKNIFSDLYHTISGNQRDFLKLDDLENVLKFLKKYK